MGRRGNATAALMASAWVLVLDSRVGENEERSAFSWPPGAPLAASSESSQGTVVHRGRPASGKRTAFSPVSAHGMEWREVTVADGTNGRAIHEDERHAGIGPLFEATGKSFNSAIGPEASGLFTATPAISKLAAAGEITQAQIDPIETGFEQYLTQIETNLLEQVFGEALALLGDNLLDAAAEGVPALHYVTALKSAINSGLGTLTGSEIYTETQVEQAISSALSAAGIISGSVNLDAANAADAATKLWLRAQTTLD